jgi:hypothetical protein
MKLRFAFVYKQVRDSLPKYPGPKQAKARFKVIINEALNRVVVSPAEPFPTSVGSLSRQLLLSSETSDALLPLLDPRAERARQWPDCSDIGHQERGSFTAKFRLLVRSVFSESSVTVIIPIPELCSSF